MALFGFLNKITALKFACNSYRSKSYRSWNDWIQNWQKRPNKLYRSGMDKFCTLKWLRYI